MAANDSLHRSVLPIPDRKPVTLTTYTAKDPDTKSPPITPLNRAEADINFGFVVKDGGPGKFIHHRELSPIDNSIVRPRAGKTSALSIWK